MEEVNLTWKASFEVWEEEERWAQMLTQATVSLYTKMARERLCPNGNIQRRVSFWRWNGLTGELEVKHTERPDSVKVELRVPVRPIRIVDVRSPEAQEMRKPIEEGTR